MASGLEVAEVFRHYGAAYRRVQAGHLGRVERRVMGAIEACRTAALGGHVERCADCGLVRISYNSCRNRHCPKCQNNERAKWLESRTAELLPVDRRVEPRRDERWRTAEHERWRSFVEQAAELA